MDDRIATAIELLIGRVTGAASSPVIDLDPFLADEADPVDRVLAAFLVAAAGPRDPRYARAIDILDAPAAGAAGETAAHLRTALDHMAAEIPTAPRIRRPASHQPRTRPTRTRSAVRRSGP